LTACDERSPPWSLEGPHDGNDGTTEKGGPRWRRHDSGRRQWRGDERRRSSSRSARATEGFDDFDVRGFEVLHDLSSTTGVVVARSLAADV